MTQLPRCPCLQTDCAFGLVFLAITLCLASLAGHHAAAPLFPLLWALALGRVAQLVALAAARHAYLRWREAFSCGLMLLQVNLRRPWSSVARVVQLVFACSLLSPGHCTGTASVQPLPGPLQVWHCCAMLSGDLFGEPPPGTLRSL